MSKYSIRTATLGLVSLFALATFAAAPAYAKGSVVKSRGTCSAFSVSKLKLSHDGAVIETSFEVDSNHIGQVWNVSIKDNTVRVFAGARTTTAPSGSFTVALRIPNRAGIDNIVAVAKNPRSGERCVARASI